MKTESSRNFENLKLLNLEEVAWILGISVNTAKIWASKRIFPVIKVGRLVRVSPRSLEEWLEKNTQDMGTILNLRKKRKKKIKFEAFVRDLRKGA